MTERPPRLIGLPTRIRLVELIGEGTSSAVWQARDTRDGVDVAVKVLLRPPPGALTGMQRSESDIDEQFEREIRSLSRLRGGPGIVAIRDVGVSADRTRWLVMDLAGGGSLRDVSSEQSNVGSTIDLADMAGRVAGQIGSALSAAHALQVVHGDVSPANILFSDDGAPLLTDFGMSALVGSGSGSTGLSGLTPAYAAPERLRGAAPTKSSDVYSLARVVTELLDRVSETDHADVARRDVVVVDGPDPGHRLTTLQAALSRIPSERPDARSFAGAFAAEPALGSSRLMGRWPLRRRN